MAFFLSVIFMSAVFFITSDASVTSASPEVCPLIYDRVGGRCIAVDIYASGTWHEIHYRCQEMGGVMVEIETPNFFYDVVQYLKMQFGDSERSYWIGGVKDVGIESPYLWNSTGTPLPEGSPFWAINESPNGQDEYDQEPEDSTATQFVYLNGARYLFFSSGAEESVTASAICQRI